MAPYLASARGSFQLLMRDYEAALEYIHPVDGHGKVYSHRTFALLLRACTEFEGLAKEGAIERGIVKRSEQPNINALSPLYKELLLSEPEVGVTAWQPATLFVRPVQNWMAEPHGLTCYRSYNAVKHNRATSFSEASLVNVTLALAGCFLLLQRLGGYKFELERHVHHDGGLVEFWFPGVSMTIRVPAEWPPITSFG